LHSERIISQQGERSGLGNIQAQGFEIDSQLVVIVALWEWINGLIIFFELSSLN